MLIVGLSLGLCQMNKLIYLGRCLGFFGSADEGRLALEDC